MNIELVPTLLDQFRETVEGGTPSCWITDGKPADALLGTIEPLTVAQAMAAPSPGGKSIAAHVAHLVFTFDLTTQRLAGQNPKADWPASFTVPDESPAGWENLKRELRRSYESVLAGFNRHRNNPIQDWPPIVAAGLSAAIAHTAYHLGSIRQMAKVVQGQK